MGPKMASNCTQKVPKWLPGALRAALSVPGGPWRAQDRFLSDLGVHLGSDLGTQNRPKMGRNLSSNPGLFLMLILGPLEASWAACGGPFWGHVEVFLEVPSREAGILKTFKTVENKDF